MFSVSAEAGWDCAWLFGVAFLGIVCTLCSSLGRGGGM